AMHQGKPLLPILTKTVFTLSLISMVPFTVLFFFGTEIFALVFGERWAVSGSYAETMSFWLMINFVLSPITALPLLLNRQKEALMVGFVSAVLQIVPFWLFPQWYGHSKETFMLCLQVVSYSQAFWLIFVVYLYFHYTRVADRKISG
ncbi:MAG: hypothetical protein RL110_1058, partial [Bacteroidota bacterium]